MGKVIDVDLAFSDLLDDKIRIADDKHVLTVSGTTDLAASFSKDSLMTLFEAKEMEGCDGFRLYPAANNDELIMIAWGTKEGNDMTEPKCFCLASNAEGTVLLAGADTVDGIQRVPITLAESLRTGSGVDVATMTALNKIRRTDSSPQELKVLFDHSFVNTEKEDFDEIVFEVVDIKLKDTAELKRTIVGYAKSADDSILRGVSFLPCPPNCTGGYGQQQSSGEGPSSQV